MVVQRLGIANKGRNSDRAGPTTRAQAAYISTSRHAHNSCYKVPKTVGDVSRPPTRRPIRGQAIPSSFAARCNTLIPQRANRIARVYCRIYMISICHGALSCATMRALPTAPWHAATSFATSREHLLEEVGMVMMTAIDGEAV